MSSILLNCSNKGCYATDYHKLDLDSDTVVCLKCNKKVNVTSYMKKSLLTAKQVFRKVDTGLRYLCPNKECGKTDTPVVLEYGQGVYQVCCSHCGQVNHHLTNFFAEPLRLNESVQRIKVKVISEGEEDTVVTQDGSPFPWELSAEQRKQKVEIAPVEEEKTEEQVLTEKQIRRETQRKAKQARIKADEEREQAARVAAQAAIIAEQEQRQSKKKGAARRPGPLSATEMLKRAGVNILTDGPDEQGNAENDNNERPKVKGGSRKTPLSTAEMLKRAGVRNLADDEDAEESDEGDGE
jgi:hypothetical protein